MAPNLDVLFAIPSAAYTLQAALAMAPTGTGAVCFKAAEGAASGQAQADVGALLDIEQGTDVTVSSDEYGFTWIACRQSSERYGRNVPKPHPSDDRPDRGPRPFTPVRLRSAHPDQERSVRRPHQAVESKAFMIHS